MIDEMRTEVNRLITKYSADPWTDDTNANRLVSLLSEHIVQLDTEYDELISGTRTLTKTDIFGPNERKAILGSESE
jgi:hypothetical protein